jgi:hypothetical protein
MESGPVGRDSIFRRRSDTHWRGVLVRSGTETLLGKGLVTYWFSVGLAETAPDAAMAVTLK